jgi:hypothetical protein
MRRVAARSARLRPADRALADALDQLEAGVPLNWSQVEDDPELTVLSALQPAANECRIGYAPVPPDLRSKLLADLVPQLPQPKAEPVKKQAAAPAGFTGKVYVPAQVAENVPRLTSTALPWVGAAIAAVLVLLFVVQNFGNAGGPKGRMGFTWIEVRQDSRTISISQRPAGWQPTQCVAVEGAAPSTDRTFLTLTDRDQIQATAGPFLEFLPRRLTKPISYTLTLFDGGVSPCVDTLPDPSDPGAIVRLSYISSFQKARTSALVSPLAVFQSRGQPTVIDVSRGEWEEVEVGDSHGIYWRGGPYHDMAGTDWIGDVSVLVVERPEVVMTFIGQYSQGVTKEMLLGVVTRMEETRKGVGSGTPPKFTWVDVVKGTQVLSAKQLPSGWQPPDCGPDRRDTRPANGSFVRMNSAGMANAYIGYPVLSVPVQETRTETYTLSLKNPQASVSPCSPGTLQHSDAGASIRLTYTGYSIFDRLGRDIRFTLFESKGRPGTFDLGSGTWEESRVGDAHMLYWIGPQYRDPAGIEWPIDTNVLLIEKNDYTIQLVGTPDAGVTQELLYLIAGMIK